MKAIFNLPDELDEMKTFIERYENADSKAADTSKTEPIIAQDEEKIQDELFEDPMMPVWEPDVSAMLKSHGLKFADCPNGGSASTNKIACKKFILDNVDKLGISALEKTIDTLMRAYPIGGEKWNAEIINDVWNFYSRCEKAGVFVDEDKVVTYLSTVPRSNRQFTVMDFIKTITLIPGEATLKRYNRGFKDKNKLSVSILTGGVYQYVIE